MPIRPRWRWPGSSTSRPRTSRRSRGLVSSITAPSPAVDPTGPLPPASRSRRRTELIMLVFAFALVAFALANVGFTLNGKLPGGAALYLAIYMAIVLVAHLAVRRFAPWADPLLLPLAALERPVHRDDGPPGRAGEPGQGGS